MEDAIKFAEETLDWVAESRAQHVREMAEHTAKMEEINKKSADQMMRLDVVSEKLGKIRHQLDNLTSDLADYVAKKA